MPKISRPVLYTGLFAVAVAAYVLTSEEPPTGARRTPKPTAKKVEQQNRGFTEADYRDPFPPVNERARNAFMPLVRRSEPSVVGITPPEGNAISEGITGEAGWIYTGMAEVNGVKQGLVENTVTGEGEFIKPGQRWKKGTVLTVTPDRLTLMGNDGVVHRMRILDEASALPLASGSGFQPLDPGIRGPIGNPNIEVRPERSRTAGRRGRAPQTEEGWTDEN
ncbi:MAG TPA: hypothetical protein VM328_08105 [Fimbriimonadaceae bacterium]|nr:hypothetical protein [Fimbriimonadaceae bacterium]